MSALHNRRNSVSGIRPSERVQQYIEEQYGRQAVKAGARLPSNRAIAQLLNVSVGTVQQVLRRKAKEGLLSMRSGSGTFWIGNPKANRTIRVAVGLPLDGGSGLDEWSRTIYGGMMHAALLSKQPVTFTGVPPQCQYSEMDQLSVFGDVDGLILFSFSLSAAIRIRVTKAFEQAGKPVVHVNAPNPEAVVNFVSPDYVGSSTRLGRAWQESGRTRILLLMGGSMAESTSVFQRVGGLLSGLGEHWTRTVSVQLEKTVHTEAAGHAATTAVLEQGGWLPDAIYTSSDYSAHGAFRALEERGIRVPDAVSVVGGSGLPITRSDRPQMTRIRQPLDPIGQQALEMLLERISSGARDIPGRYLESPFIGGETTPEKENKVLGVAGSGPAPSAIS